MDDNLYYSVDRRPFVNEILSLQTMVMRVITVNFETYMKEYKSSDSPIPKYYFEFLQKHYSQELLKALLDYGNLKQEFLDFVLNIHLKELSLKTVPKHCDIEAVAEKVKEIGSGLTRLSLMGAFNFRHLQPALTYLPNITKLELEYSGCGDDTMKTIANNCPLLKELNVYATYVTDEGMKYLCFPEKHKLFLKDLNISRTSVKENGVLLILKNMPCIQVITHENLSRIISKAASNHEFENILNLTYIEIHNAKSEMHAISELCPNIKNLFVKDIDTQKQLINCCAFKKLEEVYMSCKSSKHPSLCIDNFLRSCGLYITNLSLQNCVLSVDVLVRFCPSLQLLELCDPIFKELSDKQSLNLKFEKLTHLKIYGCSLLSDDDVKSPSFIINSSPNLESMSLQCCFIGPQMENIILNCPSLLMQLDFTESLVKTTFIKEILLKHKLLQCLIVENSGLQTEDVYSLYSIVDNIDHPVNVLWC